MLRDQEDPQKKGALVNLEDDDNNDDAPKGGRNKNKPDGRKLDKDRVNRSAEASNLREQISEMVKVKETMLEKPLETKWPWPRRNQQKEANWEMICIFEEHKSLLRSKRGVARRPPRRTSS